LGWHADLTRLQAVQLFAEIDMACDEGGLGGLDHQALALQPLQGFA
jgi:hypothetical protein